MSLCKVFVKFLNMIVVKIVEMFGDFYDECVDIMMDYLKNFGIIILKNNYLGLFEVSDRKFLLLILGGMVNGIILF